MLTWPLIQPPISEWDEDREDIVIRSPMEAGYRITRNRFSRTRKLYGPFTWQYLNNADKETLMDFFDVTTASGSLPFNVTLKIRSKLIYVNGRFSEPPKCKYVGYDKWLVTASFEEV